MLTQRIATLLSATYCAFGHRVVTCRDMLGVVGSDLTIFKLEPATRSMSQHIATGKPKAGTILRPIMLRYVALTCCGRLTGLNACVQFQMQIEVKVEPSLAELPDQL